MGMNATTDDNGSVRAILVGIDGSPAALTAVRWAAREAVRRRARIRMVNAFGWMPVHDADDPLQVVPKRRDALRRAAEESLAVAVAQVAEVAPDVEVSQEVMTGMPAALLVALSAEAQLAVVGQRGLGGFAGLLLGSVGAAVAAHAACPVLVVRGATDLPQDGPVVVGVDGSPQSDAAVAFAVEAAAARGVSLRAVHAWLDTVVPVMVSKAVDWDIVAAQQANLLTNCLAGWREKYPDLPIEPLLIEDRPAHALMDSIDDAQLVVVGSRGRGGLAGMTLGSVSQALLHHAGCPVAVVR
jgi:nucleotide-binding universal stress UspA family protein